jgi:rhodanese-related sulfurtransferase
MNTNQRLATITAALLLAAGAQTAQTARAEGPGEATRITEAMARIDPMTVTVQRIEPAAAWQMKAAHGRAVLLFDIRSRAEAALAGVADGVDALVPYVELAQPLQWDGARRDVELVLTRHFVAHAEAWIAVLGGHHDTPILLLCRDGELAAAAARELTLAGYVNVRPITNGFEGPVMADGRRRGGWKDSQPWHAQAGAELLFGSAE